MTRRWFTVGVLLLAVAAFAGWQVRRHVVGNGTWRIGRQIQNDLRRRNLPEDAPWRDRRTLSLVRAFYRKRHMHPAWTSGAGPSGQARDLAALLTDADHEGLHPDDYSAREITDRKPIDDESSKSRIASLAEFDLLCTIAAFHYMSDVFYGRISPKSLDATWVSNPRRGDLDSLLNDALRRNRVQDAFGELAPSQEGYRRLREARERFARIVEDGGWRPIPSGPSLAKGQHGKRVRALRERLAITGDLPASAAHADAFDSELDTAVRKFQSRSGFEPDGLVRGAEIEALNVPAIVRLRQIELNMERWRWLPRSFGDRYLLLNIPEYMLHVVENGRSVLDMRVVVGKELTATPIFSDLMTQVIVNPTWNVPPSIAQHELAPAVQADREYLLRNHIRVFDRDDDQAKELDASSVDWSDTNEVSRLRLRQDAGDDNALGPIKFLLPNPFDIYLHGTPAGHLFSLEERSFSHGCVRVEDPIRLARYVLRGRPEARPGVIEALIADGKNEAIKLPEPLPVHIVYLTALAEPDGMVGFRRDVYGIDQNQVEELRGRERAKAPIRHAARSS